MARLEKLIISEKLALTVVLLVCSTSLLLVDGEVVEWVQRRNSEDFYKYTSSSSHERCDGQTKATLLVDDGQCVNEQDLFRFCNHAVVPSSRLIGNALFSISSYSPSYLVGNDPNIAESFYFNGTDQPVNSTFCHIASLEVFRGWEQAIEVDHDGFSLSDNGTIRIISNFLKYSLDDFLGELYRINISCFGSTGLPEGGCVFFKAIGPLSNVTHAKFKCTVPGTLTSFDQCHNNIISTGKLITSHTELTNSSLTTTVPKTTVTSTAVRDRVDTGTDIGVIVASISCIALLPLSVIGVVILCWLKKRKKSPNSDTLPHMYDDIDDLNNQHSDRDDTLSPSMCARNPAYLHLGPEGGGQLEELTQPRDNTVTVQNPAYIYLGPETEGDDGQVEELTQRKENTVTVQNPAYIHLGPEEEDPLVELTQQEEATLSAVNRAFVHSSPKVEIIDGSQEGGSASCLSVTKGKERSDSPNTSAP